MKRVLLTAIFTVLMISLSATSARADESKILFGRLDKIYMGELDSTPTGYSCVLFVVSKKYGHDGQLFGLVTDYMSCLASHEHLKSLVGTRIKVRSENLARIRDAEVIQSLKDLRKEAFYLYLRSPLYVEEILNFSESN